MQVFHSSILRSGRRPFGKKGFTLIELLTVVATIAIITSVSFPAIQSLMTSGNFQSNTTEMSDLLESAYSAAVAKNTYVWIGFMQMPNNGGVGMAFVYSKSGNPTDISNNLQASLCKPVILKNLSLTSVGTQITDPDLVTQGVGQIFNTGNTLDVANSTNPTSFSTQLAGTTQTIQSTASSPFTTIVEITPSGQVSISSANKYAWVEVGLQPLQGNGKNIAVLQMNAFTGRVVEFLP
jgi:prepilin-type N-terminal cleavage/methylation domain-containing protein